MTINILKNISSNSSLSNEEIKKVVDDVVTILDNLNNYYKDNIPTNETIIVLLSIYYNYS